MTQHQANCILKVRMALLLNDIDEAYHWLYQIASPKFDKYYEEVWKDIESIAAGNENNESASLPSSSVTGEEDWKAKWDKLYEQFKKLDEYNVNLREENKRYRKEVDRLTPVTGESEAIGFAEWKEKNYRGNGPLYYHVDDSLKSITVTHYYNIPELYKIYKQSNK